MALNALCVLTLLQLDNSLFHGSSLMSFLTGLVITYAGCRILWKSFLQHLITLSTTKAEHVALSTALRHVISIIHLREDFKSFQLPLYWPTPTIRCRTFEDNKSCVNMASNHKTHPRTKHLSIQHYHFRSHVVKKIISVEHVSLKGQLADIFTKSLPRQHFTTLRDNMKVW